MAEHKSVQLLRNAGPFSIAYGKNEKWKMKKGTKKNEKKKR